MWAPSMVTTSHLSEITVISGSQDIIANYRGTFALFDCNKDRGLCAHMLFLAGFECSQHIFGEY